MFENIKMKKKDVQSDSAWKRFERSQFKSLTFKKSTTTDSLEKAKQGGINAKKYTSFKKLCQLISTDIYGIQQNIKTSKVAGVKVYPRQT